MTKGLVIIHFIMPMLFLSYNSLLIPILKTLCIRSKIRLVRVPAFYNGLVKMRVGKSAPTILPSSLSFIVALYFIEIPVAEAEDPEPDRIRGS